MKNLFKRFLLSLSPPEKPPLSESERLMAELEETKQKMACAWNQLDYAAPEYVELTVLEILILETQYSLLNKRFRLLQGIKDEPECPLSLPSPSKISHPHFSLTQQLQQHAFYGELYNSMAESSVSKPQDLISPN